MWSPDGVLLSFLGGTENVDTKGYSLNVYSFATELTTKIVDSMLDDYPPVWRP
jgi:hypothetical protein